MQASNTVKYPKHDKIIILRDSLFNLVGNDQTAATFLSQLLYWRDIMGRTFYKTDADFAEELHISIHKFRRIKRNIIKKLPFVKITLQQIPARTHYEIDFDMLNALLADGQDSSSAQPTKVDSLNNEDQTAITESVHTITEIKTEITKKQPQPVVVSLDILTEKEKPAEGQDVPTSQARKVDNSDTAEHTRITESAHTITEIKTEITKKQTQPVVVSLDIFNEKEKPAANKFLSTLPPDQQIAVLAVMRIAIGSRQISNKIGYLRAIVHSVHNGTFTPVTKTPPAKQQLTSAEIIQRERQRKKEEDIRHRVDNEQYFAELEAKYGYRESRRLR